MDSPCGCCLLSNCRLAHDPLTTVFPDPAAFVGTDTPRLFEAEEISYQAINLGQGLPQGSADTGPLACQTAPGGEILA